MTTPTTPRVMGIDPLTGLPPTPRAEMGIAMAVQQLINAMQRREERWRALEAERDRLRSELNEACSLLSYPAHEEGDAVPRDWQAKAVAFLRRINHDQ